METQSLFRYTEGDSQVRYVPQTPGEEVGDPGFLNRGLLLFSAAPGRKRRAAHFGLRQCQVYEFIKDNE